MFRLILSLLILQSVARIYSESTLFLGLQKYKLRGTNSETIIQNQKHPMELFYEKRCSFLKISQISQRNTSVESLFNKVAGLKACNSIKKRLQHGCLFGKFAKFLRTPVLEIISERLLLQINFLMTNNLRRRYLVKCQ